MKYIKQNWGLTVSALLLLCFSFIIVPLDFLHSHPVKTETTCKDVSKNKTCNHEVHMAVKADYCFVCAFHIDKVFDSQAQPGYNILTPTISFLSENDVSGLFVDLIFTALRGPPGNK